MSVYWGPGELELSTQPRAWCAGGVQAGGADDVALPGGPQRTRGELNGGGVGRSDLGVVPNVRLFRASL